MTRGLAAITLLLALGAVAGAPLQEARCNLERVVRGYWCERCKSILERRDIRDKQHVTCRTGIQKTEICVKYAYNACHKGPQPRPYTCCGKRAVKKEIKARILLKCEECGKAGEKYRATCKNQPCKKDRKRIVRHCTRSGATPHITPPKKSRR